MPVPGKRPEVIRLQKAFEAEAGKFPDLSLSILYFSQDALPKDRAFRRPNHQIMLWQYYGELDGSDDSANRLIQNIQTSDLALAGIGVPKELSASEQHFLALLLVKVANDQQRWVAWMQVFHAYPMRHPILQGPLGRALAQIPDEAIEAYVSSIVLFQRASNSGQPDHGRLNVAMCLREFRAVATPERRALLWLSAHRRWAAWRFDQNNPDAHLFAVAWTELDYAVVGFACECLDDAGRKQLTDKVQNAVQMLDDRWHNSITSIVTEFNRLLSQMQPFAHAAHTILNGADWLQEDQNYLPFDPTTNGYLVKKYRFA